MDTHYLYQKAPNENTQQKKPHRSVHNQKGTDVELIGVIRPSKAKPSHSHPLETRNGQRRYIPVYIYVVFCLSACKASIVSTCMQFIPDPSFARILFSRSIRTLPCLWMRSGVLQLQTHPKCPSHFPSRPPFFPDSQLPHRFRCIPFPCGASDLPLPRWPTWKQSTLPFLAAVRSPGI